MDSTATDAMDLVDQSQEAIRKAAKKMKECLDVVGGDFSASGESIMSSSRKLVEVRLQLEAMRAAASDTQTAIENAARQNAESSEEEEADEDGATTGDPDEEQIPDGKKLMTEKLKEIGEPSDEMIDGAAFLADINQVLFGPPVGKASGSQVRASPSKRGRRSGASGDLEVLQTDPVVPVDPFTKKAIEFAVKNKICRHVYDRAAFQSFLTQSQNPRCPQVGCVNREKLTRTSVVPDDETNALIQKLKPA